MTTYKTRGFEAALLRKGFRVDETDHHTYWLYVDDRKTTVRTKTSHGEKEFDDFLFSRRRVQMHVSKQQLTDFIACRFTGQDYRQTILEAGVVRLESEP